MAEDQISFKVGLDDSAVDSAIGKLQSKFLSLGAIVAGAFTFKKMISEAIEAEDAVNKLNLALVAAGRYTPETTKAFSDLADQLQQTTVFSDDMVLSAAALAQGFSKTTKQSEDLVLAATKLSAATGRDLNSSVDSLGRTLRGAARGLQEVGIGSRSFTADQLKAGAAIDYINQRFKDLAENQAKTFSGAIKILGNNFNNLLETLGLFITTNPAIRAVIVSLTKIVVELTDKIKSFGDNGAVALQNFVVGLLVVGRVLSQIVLVPLEILSKIMSTIFAVFGALSVVAEQIISGDFKKAFETIKSFKIEPQDIISLNVADTVNEQFKKLTESARNAKIGFSSFKESVSTDIKQMTDLQIALLDIIKSSSVQMISQTAQAVGAALSGNVAALEALGSTLRNILGDMLIKSGEAIILQSTAFQAFQAAIMSLFPEAGIGAGLLLIAAGAAIKGAAQSIASPTTNIAGAPGAVEPTSPQEITSKPTEILVSIEGNVLDPRGTGIAIKELLDTVFESNGSKLVSA